MAEKKEGELKWRIREEIGFAGEIIGTEEKSLFMLFDEILVDAKATAPKPVDVKTMPITINGEPAFAKRYPTHNDWVKWLKEKFGD